MKVCSIGFLRKTAHQNRAQALSVLGAWARSISLYGAGVLKRWDSRKYPSISGS